MKAAGTLFSYFSLHVCVQNVRACTLGQSNVRCASIRMHVRGLQPASLHSCGDISLARAAPLTFSWCQINLDLTRCHIQLGELL